jgi:hypothetical protein
MFRGSVLGQDIIALLLFPRRYGCACFEAEAVVSGLQDVAAVGQAVEECGRHLGIAKDRGPFAEAQVRGDTRPDALAMPLPEGLHGAAAKMAVTKMIEHGWLEEVDADIRKGEPLWRETGDGHGTTLVATDAGLLAVGVEPVVAIRSGTKQAQIITLLQRPQGAVISELVAETGWLAHSVRGVISGALKKKLCLPVTSGKVDGRGTVYKLDQTV